MRFVICFTAAASVALSGCGSETASGDGGDASSSSGGPDGGEAPGARLICPPGELAAADGACTAPGVPADGCGAGFEPTGDGGCTAVLPADPCAPGKMAVPGQTQCADVAPCGAETWGDAPIDAATMFVDADFSGGTSDGTQAAPFTTIGEAVSAATDGMLVAIAAGTYDETVTIDKPLRLWARCPEMAAISSTLGPAMIVTSAGSGSEIHDVAMSSTTSVGVSVEDATGVVLDRVWIHDTAKAALSGVAIVGSPEVALRRSLLERAGLAAAIAVGSTFTIEDSAIRDTQPTAEGKFGRAVSAEVFADTDTPSTVTIRRSAIERNAETGVMALGSTAILEDTVVRQTRSRESDGYLGTGVYAQQSDGHRGAISMRGSAIELNQYCGICVMDADLTLERTVVRDTKPEEVTSDFGIGVVAYAYQTAANPPVVDIRSSVIERSYTSGITVNGAVGTIETTIVRDTAPRSSDDFFGRGISIEPSEDTRASSKLEIRGALVERNHEFGIAILGSEGVVDSAFVRDTQPRQYDGLLGVGIAFTTQVIMKIHASGSVKQSVVEKAHVAGLLAAGADVVASDIELHDTQPEPDGDQFGDGIIATSYLVYIPGIYPTSLDVSRATVNRSARAGVATFGASVSLGSTAVSCNRIDLDGETMDADLPTETDFTFEDRGGNVCGCDEHTTTCIVATSNLEPPSLN
jgi:hypothetical protein